jgi:hypothetical protein
LSPNLACAIPFIAVFDEPVAVFKLMDIGFILSPNVSAVSNVINDVVAPVSIKACTGCGF